MKKKKKPRYSSNAIPGKKFLTNIRLFGHPHVGPRWKLQTKDGGAQLSCPHGPQFQAHLGPMWALHGHASWVCMWCFPSDIILLPLSIMGIPVLQVIDLLNSITLQNVL